MPSSKIWWTTSSFHQPLLMRSTNASSLFTIMPVLPKTLPDYRLSVATWIRSKLLWLAHKTVESQIFSNSTHTTAYPFHAFLTLFITPMFWPSGLLICRAYYANPPFTLSFLKAGACAFHLCIPSLCHTSSSWCKGTTDSYCLKKWDKTKWLPFEKLGSAACKGKLVSLWGRSSS